MSERYKSILVVDLMITRVNKENKSTEVLLALRKNTGSYDGQYELPGGHVEANEDLLQAIIREAKEELDIDLEEKDLKFIHILHHYTEDRLNFIVTTEKYKGILKINEPEKCAKLEWFDWNKLPENTTIKVKNSIQEIKSNIFFDNINFKKLKN